MPKTKEFTNFERASVINLRKNGLSFIKIGAAIDCHHSTIIRICKCDDKIGSPDKIKRCGRPKKVDVRGERYVCRLAKQHRFSNLKTVTNELIFSNLQGNLSKWTVKRILKKYGIRTMSEKENHLFPFEVGKLG